MAQLRWLFLVACALPPANGLLALCVLHLGWLDPAMVGGLVATHGAIDAATVLLIAGCRLGRERDLSGLVALHAVLGLTFGAFNPLRSLFAILCLKLLMRVQTMRLSWRSIS